MAPKRDEDKEFILLSQRLQNSFSNVYLTMLSIIQGVALSVLAAVVYSGYQQFNSIQWVLVPCTFIIYLMIWYQLSMNVTTWEWILRFEDSFVVFIAGGIEFALAYSIPLVTTFGLRIWLWTNAFSAVMGVIGIYQVDRHALQEEKNRNILLRINKVTRFRKAYMLLTAVATLVLALIGFVKHLDTADSMGVNATTYIAIGAAVVIGAFMVLSIVYWNLVVKYSQTGLLPRIWRK